MIPRDVLTQMFERIRQQGRRPADQTPLGDPVTRRLLGIALALAVLLACFSWLPESPIQRVGWVTQPTPQYINVIPLAPQERPDDGEDDFSSLIAESYVVQPRQFDLEEAKANEADTPDPEEDPAPEAEAPEEPTITPMMRVEKIELQTKPVLEFAEEQPDIVGGLGSVYLNIDYPEEARRAGIEGRVILSYVVEPNGEATDIRVMQSLHPLCDSSAVAAVKRTNFIPGRQNGQPVRVRMHLPIRFKLIAPDSTETGTSNQQ